jgi:transglutaminase-like putative cysteine protease
VVTAAGNAGPGGQPHARAAWTRTRRLIVATTVAAMVACAGLTLDRIYDGSLLAELVAAAAAGSVLCSLLTQRLPGWTTGPLSALGLLAYTLVAVRLSAAAADLPGGVVAATVDAARNGIPRMLIALIPIEPQPDTVLVPVAAAWLAALGGAELAGRGRRVLLGYAAPALFLAATLYVVGPNAGFSAWPVLGFAGFAALGLAAGARPAAGPDRQLPPPAPTVLRVRGAAGAVGVLVVLSGLAMTVGPAVAGRTAGTPDDPRRYLAPPRLDVLDESPLSRLSGWAVNPGQHLLDATVDTETRLRLAVLPDYDGVTWRVGGLYRPAGRSLPPTTDGTEANPGVRPVDRVTQAVTVAELGGHLVPAVGTPHRVDGLRVAFDAATGTLARPEGLTPGVRYTVVSQRPQLDVNLLPAADVPAGPAVARLLALGAPPPQDVERLARQLVQDQAGPYQRAAAIEQFLAEHYRLAADAPSGHAYPNLAFFLFGPRNAGGQQGTSEQFAAAFAVLGRIVGLPTRVAVGFQLRAGTHRVTAADALAWPEVLFTGVGWVPFHPLPDPQAEARPVEEDFRPKPETSAPPPSEVPTVAVSLPPANRAASLPAPPVDSTDPVLPVVGTALGGIVALGVLGFCAAVPLLRRAQRRRRLDRGPPPQRVAGAWRELTEALRLAGRPASAAMAATEVGVHAELAAGLPRSAHRRRRVRRPAPPLDQLTTAVNAATFGPEPPDEEAARRATGQAAAYVAELRARRPGWQRLLWTLHPGPLLPSWRRARPTPHDGTRPARQGWTD